MSPPVWSSILTGADRQFDMRIYVLFKRYLRFAYYRFKPMTAIGRDIEQFFLTTRQRTNSIELRCRRGGYRPANSLALQLGNDLIHHALRGETANIQSRGGRSRNDRTISRVLQ